jgi:hypothetical protein
MEREYNEKLVAHYRIFRDYLQHEDDLINHRSTWHHTIQGLLFTALGVTLSKLDPTATRHAAAIQKTLIVSDPETIRRLRLLPKDAISCGGDPS